MLVMHFNLISWNNGKLAASELIHCCSFQWFSLWEAAADGPALRVHNFFILSWAFVSCDTKYEEAVILNVEIAILYVCIQFGQQFPTFLHLGF